MTGQDEDTASGDVVSALRRRVAALERECARLRAAAARAASTHGAATYRALILSSSQGICITRNWRALFANQAIADILGYESPDQIVAQDSLAPLIAAHERDRLRRYHAAWLGGQAAPERYVAEYVRRDGRSAWLECVNRVVDWDGEPAMQSTFIDVTQRVEAEAALRQSEQRFKDFAEASSDWFWEMGPDLRITWFSNDYRAGIGRTRPDNSSVGVDTREWRRHLADLEAHRPFRDFRYMGHDEDDNEIHASVNGLPVFDADGRFAGYRGTATDITSQVRAEQEATKARAMLSDAVESVRGGFAMFDRQGRIVLCNQGYRRHLQPVLDALDPGFTWTTMVRSLIEHGVLKPPAENLDAWLEHHGRKHHAIPCVRRYETNSGRHIEIRSYPTQDGGFTTVRADITELKQAEEALKASEQRFKDFAEASSDWFWEMGPDLRFSWFSHRSLKGTGIDTDKLIGKTRLTAGRRDTDAGKWRGHMATLKARRPFRDFRYRTRNEVGEDIYFSISGVPVFDPDGTFLGYRGCGKNITPEVLAEQRAADAQNDLNNAIESVREGFALFDRHDRLVLCNENYRTSLPEIADVLAPGVRWETALRVLVERGGIRISGEDREAWIQSQITRHRSPGCTRDFETRNGRWLQAREYPTRDGGLGIVRADITEIKHAEAALRESETLLKHAAQIADLGHWVWDEQVDRCIHCSEGLARMYGMTPDDYIASYGTHATAVRTIIPDDRDRYEEVIRRAARLKKGYDIEFRERLADGAIRYMRERGEPVLNEEGALVRTVGILQDITKHKNAEQALRRIQDQLEHRVDERTAELRGTNRALAKEVAERKRTEAALRESRGLLEAIVEAAAMGINVKGPDHRYVFMNGYQAAVYGVTPDQAVGKLPGELINPEYGRYIGAHDRRVIETGEAIPYFEEEIPDKNGLLRTWLTTKVPVKDDQGVLHYIVSTSLDVTELKARERELKQAQKMDAVGKLTGGIAHDFNNLLFVIRGNVALLKDEIRDSSAARECLRAIQDAAKLGADLTRSLLAFSKQQPLEPAIVHLPEVIAHTTATLLRPFEKSIEIETSYPEHVWPVLIDRHQLENALLNLALNARDAMPDGGRLRIAVENRRATSGQAKRGYYLPSGDYVQLVVADTGVGMPFSVVEHVFEPFFTTKPAGSGTGLGLSMVYGFIKQSGGFIDVDSSPGHGTTITMHLPRCADRDRSLMGPETPPWVTEGSETILVTEDDAAVRRVAVRILTKLGYNTREASNGAEALAILEREPAIDLLFADIVLSGGLNGAQLAREAQARWPKLKLLFASGYSKPAVLRDTEGADSVPLLSKPYDAEQLGKLVRRLLDDDGQARSG